MRFAMRSSWGVAPLYSYLKLRSLPQTVSRFEGPLRRYRGRYALAHDGGRAIRPVGSGAPGQKRVVVGARSALFCPMATLGLIVIDERD